MDVTGSTRTGAGSGMDRRRRLRCRPLVLGVLAIGSLGGCGDSAEKPEPAADSAAGDSTAQELLDRMFAVYRDCRTYADNAVYRERWVLREDGVVREPPPQMVSVSFERPAKIRITRREPDAEGGIAKELTLVSTGSRMYHTLPRFPRQVLETVAPLTLTADNLATAPHVAEGLFFNPLEDSFPQIDLLLSAAPQNDALAAGSPPKLLDEALLGDRGCFRVALTSNAGQRVYWIDKESYVLRRLDLPAGEVRETLDPHDRLRSLERWIELPDAVVDVEIPAAAFEMEVPPEAVVVREWVGGYPGPEPSGPDASPEQQELYAARLAKYEADLAAAATEGSGFKVEVAAAEIAPPSEPQKLRLEHAWQADGLESPGNVYVVNVTGEPRLHVIDGGMAVAELSMDGKLIKRHELEVLEGEQASQLRTTQDAGGDRWFAVSGPGQQRIHVFNGEWKHEWSFPEHDNPGIGDFAFAPFGDAGTPDLVVGFWGDLGVHGVRMDGRRKWVDRSLQQVLALALATGDRQNPVVWTVHGRDVIGRVGSEGSLSPLFVAGRSLVDLAAADLNGDGQQEACGIAFVELGVYDAVGFDAQGVEQWSYRLPKGEFEAPVRRIVAAHGDSLAGWIFPAADGSVHIVSPQGELLDQFATGKPITGIEFAEHQGRRLLIMSSPDGVSARGSSL